MQLSVIAAPFDDPDWLFEFKHDGFRALAYLSDGWTLVSRKNNQYKSFGALRESLAQLNMPAILDGEIVCLDAEGKSHFWPLMSRKAQVSFYAFDCCGLATKTCVDCPSSSGSSISKGY
jgi:bifunctional non-homologous end joining protein LigD